LTKVCPPVCSDLLNTNVWADVDTESTWLSVDTVPAAECLMNMAWVP
jgi:hypothetical protein